MILENKIHELIIGKMKNYPSAILGITDTSYSDYFDQYKCALVLAVPLK